MSAPDRLVTPDGTVWTHRAERGGEALYAPEGIRTCPEYVMATEAELAEYGIVGSADVLPVPPGPQRGVLDRARDAVDARLSQDALRHVLQNVISYAARMENRVAELEAAALAIVHLHKDSPMGSCPVCIDGDAMVRGDDYTVPYPCPTARLAGAQDCDPPSYVSRPLPPRDAVCARPGCGHPGVEHHHGDTRCWARLPRPLGAPTKNCGCTSFVAETGGDA